MSQICLAFQGYQEEGGQLWWASYDGANWTGEEFVPNVGMSYAPSPVAWNGRLHVFHQGAYRNGELSYTYYDGSHWQPDQQVQPVGMSFSPSAVVYRDQLFVFHRWADQNGELWYKVYDGTSWQPDTKLLVGGGMSFSPAAVVWQDKLFVFFQGSAGGGNLPGGTGGGGLFYMVYDGTTWQPPDPGDGSFPFYQVPGVAMSSSPSPVVWNGVLHVFHQWAYDHPELWYTYFDGTTWTVDNPGSWSPDMRVDDVIVPIVFDYQSISAVNYNSKLYVFHQNQQNRIACKIYDGTSWQPDTPVFEVPQTTWWAGCAVY